MICCLCQLRRGVGFIVIGKKGSKGRREKGDKVTR
jgi:hypothetical protein